MRRPSQDAGVTSAQLSPRLAYRAVLLALGLLAAGLLFKQLSQLALLVAISIMVALPIAAGAGKLQRFGVPRVLGALLSLLAGGAIVAAILFFAIPAFVNQVQAFVAALPTTVSHFEHGLNQTFGLRPGTVTRDVTHFAQSYTHHPNTLLGPLSSIGMGVATGIGALVVVLISAIYMAVSPRPLVDAFLRLFDARRQPQAIDTLERIRGAWLGWLRSLFVDMLATGVLLFVGLKLDGLAFAGGFAIFSALLAVIPYYGALIGAVPPVVFALTLSWERALVVIAIYVTAYQLESRLMPESVRGRGMRLHPAVVGAGALIMTSLFGVLGLIVSVPLVALVIILVDELWVRRYGSGPSAERELVSVTDGPTR